MTLADRSAMALDPPRHAGGAVNVTRVLGNAAPALFRLLSDSALNRAALDACGAPVAIIDARATGYPVVYVNPAFETLFGYGSNEALGKPARKLLVCDAEALLDWLPWGGELAQVEIDSHRKDDSPIRVKGIAGDVRDTRGECTHWVLTFNDLSKR